jgi:hypothetical protein
MNATTQYTSARPGFCMLTVLSAVIVVMALGTALPASADPRKDGNTGRHYTNGKNYNNRRDWNERMSWNEHEREARNWRRDHRQPYYSGYGYPGYVYAPPPVVYAPYDPSPGITLILPLDFR